jgi:hypothetical protein
MIEFDAGIRDPLLTNAELAREPVSIKLCRPCAAATFAAICREHLWKLHLVTRANVMARAVVTRADALGALNLLERHPDDGELRQHLIAQLRRYLQHD